MPWKFGAAMDIGGRNEQQDRLAILHSQNGRKHLVVIADGMGGLRNGAIAAQALIDAAAKSFERQGSDDPYTFLKGICQTAHDAINGLQNPDEPGSAPGTTALLLYIGEQTASWAHIGDSRLYHFRSGSLLNQTNDHSVMQLMIDKGLVEAGSIAALELQNQLYMRLGGEGTAEPDFNSTAVEEGDLFLLCSDGLWQTVQPAEMIAALDQYPPDRNGPQYLVELARQRSGEGGDNISIAVAQWSGSGKTGLRAWLANLFFKPNTL